MGIKKLAEEQISEKIEVIDNLIYAYKFFQVLRTAIDSGLFDWLEKTGASTREEIAVGVNLQGLFMKGYLQSLVDLGFLVRSAKRYSNSSIASSSLTRHKDTYQGERLSLTASSDWKDLLQMFRSKNPMLNFYEACQDYEVEADGIHELDRAIHRLSIPLVMPKRAVGV